MTDFKKDCCESKQMNRSDKNSIDIISRETEDNPLNLHRLFLDELKFAFTLFVCIDVTKEVI